MTLVDWSFAVSILPLLARAALVTLAATVIGFVIAMTVGLLLAVLRRSPIVAVAWPVTGFIEFVRSTPLLIQLYFVFFVLPEFGLTLPAFLAGALTLGLHYSAYTSEVYRAGIEGVPAGQWEAAQALGLSPLRIYWRIIIPQAIPPVVPALGNYLISMFKETPLLSAIAIVELMQQAKIIGSESFRYLEPITIVGLFFLVMSLFAAGLVRRVERTLRRRQAARSG